MYIRLSNYINNELTLYMFVSVRLPSQPCCVRPG